VLLGLGPTLYGAGIITPLQRRFYGVAAVVIAVGALVDSWNYTAWLAVILLTLAGSAGLAVFPESKVPEYTVFVMFG